MPPLGGLGTDRAAQRRLCRDDKEALDLLDRAVSHAPNRPTTAEESVDIVHTSAPAEERPRGNTAARALRKLRADRPDLHKRVLAGELSPHGAMVEAGLRERTITIPIEPAAAARLIRKHFTEGQIDALLAALED
jgi:hypothetical protein